MFGSVLTLSSSVNQLNTGSGGLNQAKKQVFGDIKYRQQNPLWNTYLNPCSMK